MNIRQDAIGAGIAIGVEVLPRLIHGVSETAAEIEERIASIKLPRGVLDLRPKNVPESDPWAEVYRGEVLGRQSRPAYYTKPDDGLPVEALNGETIRTRFAIIGGGHAGLPAAFKLAEAGQDVALLEGGVIGDERIPSSHAMILTIYPDLDFAPIEQAHGPAYFNNLFADLKAAQREVMDRAARHGSAVDFSRLTSHKIDYAEESPVKEEFDLLSRQRDPDFRLLRGADAEAVLPGAKWALAVDNEAAFSGYKELRAWAKEANFPIFQNTYVIGIRPREGSRPIELLTADGGRVFADHVYIAGGRPIRGMEDSRQFVVPLQAHSTRTLITADRRVSGNNFDNGASFNYFRPAPEDKLVPPGMKSLFLGGDARFVLDGGKVVPQSEHMPVVAREMFGGTTVAHGNNMVYGTVIDGVPILQRHPHLDGVMVEYGNGGNGAVTGGMAAEHYRRIVMGETTDTLLSPDRFYRVPLEIRTDPALGPYRARF
jgi:glycine/D-amino acid oxidase-like deaminating enzyme